MQKRRDGEKETDDWLWPPLKMKLEVKALSCFQCIKTLWAEQMMLTSYNKIVHFKN